LNERPLGISFPQLKTAEYLIKLHDWHLQGLPGVGPARAKLLLDKFDSLNAVFNASISDMKVAKGIGTYTAEKIYSVLHERLPAYL